MNNCFNCNKETKNPKFCNRTCSVTYNNQKFPKRKKEGKCKRCNAILPTSKRYCDTCPKLKQTYFHYPISELIYDVNNTKDKFSRIRKLARQYCEYTPCKKCGYLLHVEVCHIKSISSFSLTATLGEVNHKNNLICLCRNCHWELDNGHLDISVIKGHT